jgi:DNA-binding GntR family transcriptional regulator
VNVIIEKREKSKPAYQKSYEIIRDKILDGELPGGMKIVEEKLANKWI